MNKIKKIFNKKRKQAQHLVEFTILMPVFVAIFGLLLPTMAGSLRHFAFSYNFEGAVMSAINELEKSEPPNPPPVDPYTAYKNRLIETIQEKVGNNAVITIVDMGETNPVQSVFIHGAISEPVRMFYYVRGKNHFYSAVPINRNLFEPTIPTTISDPTAPSGNNPLNSDMLKDVFETYYTDPTPVPAPVPAKKTFKKGKAASDTNASGGETPSYNGIIEVPSGTLGE